MKRPDLKQKERFWLALLLRCGLAFFSPAKFAAGMPWLFFYYSLGKSLAFNLLVAGYAGSLVRTVTVCAASAVIFFVGRYLVANGGMTLACTIVAFASIGAGESLLVRRAGAANVI
jgi:hypothetical protein